MPSCQGTTGLELSENVFLVFPHVQTHTEICVRVPLILNHYIMRSRLRNPRSVPSMIQLSCSTCEMLLSMHVAILTTLPPTRSQVVLGSVHLHGVVGGRAIVFVILLSARQASPFQAKCLIQRNDCGHFTFFAGVRVSQLGQP